MSDRLAVMRTGRIEQVGAPRDVYDEPANAYVADFLGLANLLPCVVAAPGVVQVAGASLSADTAGLTGACQVLVRPERVRLVAPGDGDVPATVERLVFAGALTHVHARIGEHPVQAVIANDGSPLAVRAGGMVDLVLARDALRVLAG